MTLSSALISWEPFLSGIVGTGSRGKLFQNSLTQLHSLSLIIYRTLAPRKSSSLVYIMSDISVYPEVGLPTATSLTAITGNPCQGCCAVLPRWPLQAILPAAGRWLFGSSHLSTLCRVASAEESVLVQGHTHSPGQSPASDWSKTESKGPASSLQLKKTALMDHPSFPAPGESAEAFAETVLQPTFFHYSPHKHWS